MLCEKFDIYHKTLEKYEADALRTYEANAYRFEKKYVAQKCVDAKLCEEHEKLILDFIDYASNDENLLKFMWLYYYFQFETEECYIDNLWGNGLGGVPIPAYCEERFPGALKSTVYLVASDHLLEFVKKVGLPESYIDEYYSNYRRFAVMNIITHDTYGLCRLASFVYAYAYPLIVSVERLTFQIISFRDYCEVYEDKDGMRTIIALPNYSYNETGYRDEESDFYPTHEIKNDILEGYTFDEMGLLKRKPVKLNLKEWQRIMAPGDKVITIHIPGEGKLTPEIVDKTLDEADRILPKCFEEYEVKGYVCQTWFLDTQLREVVSENSNMIKFQHRFDLVMAGDNKNHSLFEHIFNVKPTELKNLVPKNNFQKKMLDRALAGKKMYWGYGILKRR